MNEAPLSDSKNFRFDWSNMYVRLAIILISGFIIYVFRDSQNLLRLLPFIFLVVILHQVISILIDIKPKLDEWMFGKPKSKTVNEIAHKACLKIVNEQDTLEISQKFRIGEKSMIGIYFFLFGR